MKKYFFKLNFYAKFRSKLVKISNFETPSPIFAAPSEPIELTLINFKIYY
jgi:hypothetical protein